MLVPLIEMQQGIEFLKQNPQLLGQMLDQCYKTYEQRRDDSARVFLIAAQLATLASCRAGWDPDTQRFIVRDC